MGISHFAIALRYSLFAIRHSRRGRLAFLVRHPIFPPCVPASFSPRPRPASIVPSPASMSIRSGRWTARLITHGHADHARAGHGAVLATPETLAIMEARYGEDFAGARQAAALGEAIRLGGVERRRFRPAGHVLGSAQVALDGQGLRDRRLRRLQARAPTRPARRSSRCPATCSSPRRPSACRCSAIRRTREEIARLLARSRMFPERAHVVGCYALGKAQRVIALLREAGYDAPIYLHGAMVRPAQLYESSASRSATAGAGDRRRKGDSPAQIVIARPRPIEDRWARRLPDPVVARRLGLDAGRAARPAARRRAAAGHLRPCRLGRADRHHRRDRRRRVWVTHGREEALVYWSEQQGIAAGRCTWSATTTRSERGGMKRFRRSCSTACCFTPSRNRKLRADAGLFPRDARSRSRLGAGHPHRRADLRQRQAGGVCARWSPSGSIPILFGLVLRLCRRSRRDHRADLAAPGTGAKPRRRRSPR